MFLGPAAEKSKIYDVFMKSFSKVIGEVKKLLNFGNPGSGDSSSMIAKILSDPTVPALGLLVALQPTIFVTMKVSNPMFVVSFDHTKVKMIPNKKKKLDYTVVMEGSTSHRFHFNAIYNTWTLQTFAGEKVFSFLQPNQDNVDVVTFPLNSGYNLRYTNINSGKIANVGGYQLRANFTIEEGVEICRCTVPKSAEEAHKQMFLACSYQMWSMGKISIEVIVIMLVILVVSSTIVRNRKNIFEYIFTMFLDCPTEFKELLIEDSDEAGRKVMEHSLDAIMNSKVEAMCSEANDMLALYNTKLHELSTKKQHIENEIEIRQKKLLNAAAGAGTGAAVGAMGAAALNYVATAGISSLLTSFLLFSPTATAGAVVAVAGGPVAAGAVTVGLISAILKYRDSS
jgi:ABC-type multidrug transport system fused ATPase/permease subunit